MEGIPKRNQMTIDQQQARFNKAIVGCADEMVRILVDPEMLQPVVCPFCNGTGLAVQHPYAKEPALCGCCRYGKLLVPVALMEAI